MGGYKDMMHMIGNFKHVPTVLENLHKMTGKGDNKYYHGGKKHYNTGGMMDSGISTAGGGSYQGLTPYGYEDTLDHPLISPKVQAYDNGGSVNPTDPPTEPFTEEIFLRQLMKESDFRSDVTSSAGAVSMAQITPDTFQDGLGKGYVPKGTTIQDLINDPSLARQFQEAYMNDLYGRDWNKGDDKVKIAKSLVAYNMGPTGLVDYLNEQKAKGVDIYSEAEMSEWISGLNEESRNYVNTILFGGDERFETDFTKLSGDYRTSTPSGSGGEEEYKYGGKMRSYKKGGIFEEGGISTDFYKSDESKEDGAFPRIRDKDKDEFPNMHLNQNAYIAVAMARYYGYDKVIDFTSGQRSGHHQHRIFKNYQYGDHRVYANFPAYQEKIAEALGISAKDYTRGNYMSDSWVRANTNYNSSKELWDAADWDIPIKWQDDLYLKRESGEISFEEAGKLFPFGHMDAASGDFVGDFQTWLLEGKAGTNKQAAQFIKDFNVTVLLENKGKKGEHVHVTFPEIDPSNLSESNQNFYNTHLSQFDNLSTEGDVPGTTVINMNPSHYREDDGEGNITYNFKVPETEPINLPLKEVRALDTEIPEPTVTGVTLPAGYNEYQSYLKEQSNKPAYKFAEQAGQMPIYQQLNPTLSFNEWLQENPEYMEQAGTVPVNPYQTQNISDVDWTGDPIQDIHKLSQFSRAKSPSKSVIQSPHPETGELNIPTENNPYQLEGPSVPNIPSDSPTKVPFFETEEGKKFAKFAEQIYGPNWQSIIKERNKPESDWRKPFAPKPDKPLPWAPKWPDWGFGPQPDETLPWGGRAPYNPNTPPTGGYERLPSPYNPYDPRTGNEPPMWALLDEDAISDEVEKIKKIAY